jgi:hypothetical protein
VRVVSPSPKLEDHPLPFVRGCLFNIFAASLQSWRPFLPLQPEDQPCFGDRDAPNIDCYYYDDYYYYYYYDDYYYYYYYYCYYTFIITITVITLDRLCGLVVPGSIPESSRFSEN